MTKTTITPGEAEEVTLQLVDSVLIGSTSPIVGVPTSLAYNRSGASRALVGALLQAGQFQACMAIEGAPIMTIPF